MVQRIKILVVDDSALAREALCEALKGEHDFEVMRPAQDPFAAAERMRSQAPDVILLDIEMPRMDGLTFLKRLMRQHPIPTVICSSLAAAGSATALEALEAGAVDILEKPSVGTRQFFEDSRIRICDTVRAAASARLPRRTVPREVAPKLTADVILERRQSKAMLRTTDKVVVVGASTGGTEALRVLLEALPGDCPGFVIVQHMPERFTTHFAQRLNDLCTVSVKEAENGDYVLAGQALIAPGNRHLLLKRSGARYYVEINDGPLVSRHRPSVDVLFRSAAEFAGANAVGVIMTGMGDDGAHGMLEMRQAGAKTFAQNEETCVVYGMPKEAVKLGGVDKVMPLDALAPAAIRACAGG